ncbi:MAG: hypothetical protein P1V51_12575 [Deltaproteobacteria bacterium]|nr:hypothetical protein [Deltaproteobacteria bacterium]
MRPLLALLFLALLGTGCPKKPSAEEARRIQELWARSKIDAARFEALILNRGAYQGDLDHKYPKIWAGLEIDRQIPEKPDAGALRQRLEDQAIQMGLTPRLEVKKVAAPVPTLPARVGPDEPVAWPEAALLREEHLTLVLEPADLGKAEAWFEQRGHLGRRLFVRSVKLGGGSVRIEATAYSFRDDLPLPVRTQPPFDFAALLAEAGLPASLVEQSPKLQEVKARYEELEAQRPRIDEALALRTRAEWMDARYGAFLKVVERCDQQRWLEVLK